MVAPMTERWTGLPRSCQGGRRDLGGNHLYNDVNDDYVDDNDDAIMTYQYEAILTMAMQNLIMILS